MKSVSELKIKIAEYQKVSRKARVLWTRLKNLEGIAHSPVGLNQFFLEVAVHLVAQPGNQHVDDVGQRIEVVTPDVFYNHRLRHDSAGVAHQVFQKPKLARLQIEFGLAAPHLAR